MSTIAEKLFFLGPRSSAAREVSRSLGAAEACGSAGLWQLALQLLGSMPERRILPTAVSCNAAISACALEDLWPQGLRLLGAMAGGSLRAWAALETLP